MKNKLKLAFIAIFFLLCSIPVFTMPLFSEDTGAENRELSARPSLVTSEGEWNRSYPAEVSTYLSEHMSFRSQLITALTLTEMEVFSTSAEDQVIAGRDGWLYFSKTLDDFTGKDVLSDQAITNLATTLDLVEEYTQKNGAAFVFFAAPNKNTVYPQFMPYYYTRSTAASNLDKLSELLSDRAYYLDMRPVLGAAEIQVYHKRDTHWNNGGARLCFDEVMKKLARDATDYSRISCRREKTWQGDLDKMLFPSTERFDDQLVYAFDPAFTYVSRYRTPEDITIKTANSQKSGSLLMFRDSFTNALLPFFAEDMSAAEFSRVMPYRLNTLEKGGADAVVIEIAERNLPNLLKSAPVMPAPSRQGDAALTAVTPEALSTRTLSGMRHVYGRLPAGTAAGDIYIAVSSGEDTAYYQAFPIYEAALMDGTDEVRCGGFSAYLPGVSEKAAVKIYIAK